VLIGDRIVGLSTYQVYKVNVQSWFSLAMINSELAVNGTEVSIFWGEEGGSSQRPAVERHVQTEIRAVVRTTRY
jgi:vanillate/3-O-methylgallate O-demethylase